MLFIIKQKSYYLYKLQDSDSDSEEDAPPKKELVHLEKSFIPRSKIPYKSKQEQLQELVNYIINKR